MAAQHAAGILNSRTINATASQAQQQQAQGAAPAVANSFGSVSAPAEKAGGDGGAAQNNGAASADDSLRFAVAFRTRAAEPAAAAGTPSHSAVGTLRDGAKTGSAAASQGLPPAAEPPAEQPAIASGTERQNCHSGSAEASVAASRGSKRPREGKEADHMALSNGGSSGSRGQSENGAGEGDAGHLSRERGIAAAAAAFAEGTAQGSAVAVVDLKKPEWVVNVDVMPVGGRAICALGLVSADCITLRPKLAMMQIGSS